MRLFYKCILPTMPRWYGGSFILTPYTCWYWELFILKSFKKLLEGWIKMNKKIGLIILVVLLAAAGLGIYNYYLAPEGVEGAKIVSLEIVIEDEGIDEDFEFNTDAEFLLGLLEEEAETLGAGFESFDFGTMVVELMDYEADGNQEYFHLMVNGEDAERGPGEVPLEDESNYRFELRGY